MVRCNHVKKAARLFRKELRNEINLCSVINCLKEADYEVIFFNTPLGNNLIKAYGLEQDIETKKSFICYEVDEVKKVFIDGTLHNIDKLYLLLHEIGHILLNHIGEEQNKYPNMVLDEIEADAFAYDVLIHSNAYCMV